MSTLEAVVFLAIGIAEILVPAIILYRERERNILGYVAGGVLMAVGLLVACIAWQQLNSVEVKEYPNPPECGWHVDSAPISDTGIHNDKVDVWKGKYTFRTTYLGKKVQEWPNMPGVFYRVHDAPAESPDGFVTKTVCYWAVSEAEKQTRYEVYLPKG